MGRTTITMQAKRSWTAAIRSYLAPTVRTSGIARNNNNSAAVSDITTLADREVDLTTPHPMVIHQILASLPNLPAERNERNELLLPNGTEHDFLNARSYTVRTLNDPSAEVEYDHDLYSAGLPHSAASLGLSSGQLSPGSPISSMTATLQQNLQLMNSLQYPATYLGMQHRAYAGHPGATPTTATALNGGGYYTRPLGEMEEINNNILMNASIHHMLYATTLDAAASPVQSPAAVAQGERMDVATPATGTMLSPILEHPPAGSSSSGRMGSSTGRAVLLTDSNGDVMSAESYSAGFEKVNHPTMVFRTTSPLPDDGDNSPSTPHRPGGTAPRAAPATGPATPPRHHSPSTFLKDEAMGPVDDLEHSTIADDQVIHSIL